MAEAVRVRGMRELQAAFALADRSSRTLVRREFRQIAEPVRREAERLALSGIPKIAAYSPRWAKMRIGVTRRVVYVAPVQRGVKARGGDPRRRPNFAGLLMSRSLEPALDHNEAEIVHGIERALDHLADSFNHGGRFA